MRIVVDSSIFIAALIRDSATRRILTHLDVEFITVSLSKKEIKKHLGSILKKSKLTEEAFWMVWDKLFARVAIADDSLVSMKMEQAKRIMDKVDPADTPFVALALATKAAIWSDDGHFQKQKAIRVLTTKEMVKLLQGEFLKKK